MAQILPMSCRDILVMLGIQGTLDWMGILEPEVSLAGTLPLEKRVPLEFMDFRDCRAGKGS